MGKTPMLRVMPRRVVNATDERMRLLAEQYAAGRLTLAELETCAEQAANGKPPTLNGRPVIADPDLYNVVVR